MSNFQARGLMSPTPDPLEIVNKPSVSTVGQSGSPGLNTTPPPPTGMLNPASTEYSSPFDVDMSTQQAPVTAPVKPESNKTLTKSEFIAQATKDIQEVGRVKPSTLEGINYQYNSLQSGKGSASEAELNQAQQYAEWAQAPGAYSEGTDVDEVVENIMYSQLSSVKEGTAMDVMDVVVPLATIALTAGAGTALAGTSAISGIAGGNSMIAAGIGKGIAAGGVTALQGGDTGDVLKSAVMGGIAGAAGESTKLLSDTAHMATLSESAASGLQATSELLNTTNTVLKTAEAIDKKDIIGVVQGGLKLSGLPSIGKFTSDTLMENFPDSAIVMKHADSISTGIIKAYDSVLKGATPAEALQSGIQSYFKDGGGLALGEFELDMDTEGFGLPESLQPIVDAFKDGIDAIDKNVVTPVLDTVKEVNEGADKFIRELPGEIEDIKEVAETVNEPIDEVIRAIPGTKEDAEDVGDWLVDKGKGALEFLAGNLLGGSSGGSGGSGGAQAPKDEYVDLTNITLNPSEMAKGFEYESLSNPYLRG